MISTDTILDRFLEPFTESLTPEAARRLVELHLDAETDARLAALREKANEGQLTEEERNEYEEFVEVLDLIGILQAKARSALTKRAS